MSHAKPDDYLKIKTYARTIDYLKQFAKLPGFGQSVLYRKEVKESTPLQMKMGAYTDVLHALERYSKILNKAKETKKAKLAMKMMKNLQRSFFANEQWIGEIKGGQLGSVASNDTVSYTHLRAHET